MDDQHRTVDDSGDGVVGINDFSMYSLHGAPVPVTVGILDLLILLGNWG